MKVLFVERNSDGTVGGSHLCMLEIVQHLDPDLYSPVVLFYQSNGLMDEFAVHAEVILAERPASIQFGGDAPGILASAANLLIGKPWTLVNLFIRQIIRWYLLLKRRKIDIIHINNSIYGCLDWVVAAKAAGIPIVAHHRGYGEKGSESYTKLFSKIICISHDVRRYLVQNDSSLESNTIVVHDGIDSEGVAAKIRRTPGQVREEFGIGPEDILIGMVGNIKEWKGQEVLVSALALMEGNGPPFRCLIVGDVSKYRFDRDYLERVRCMIRENGLEGMIAITGYRNDVPEIVNSLDILVHASTTPEPMGRVILEGMALSRCVVATAHGGPLEIIEDGKSGFLVPPKDPDALAERLSWLMDSPGNRAIVGEHACRRVSEAFHIKKNVALIQEIYESL